MSPICNYLAFLARKLIMCNLNDAQIYVWLLRAIFDNVCAESSARIFNNGHV